MDGVPDFKQTIRILVNNGIPLDTPAGTDLMGLKATLVDAGIPRNLASDIVRIVDTGNRFGIDWEFLEEYDRDLLQSNMHNVSMLKPDIVSRVLDLMYECVAPPSADLIPTLRFALVDDVLNVYGTDEEDIRLEVPEQVRLDGGLYDVSAVGIRAFWGCTVLSDIKLPSTVTHIGRHAFWGCTGLMYLDLPGSLVEIGSDAYSRCSSLVRVNLPDSLRVIGRGAFSSCTSLKSIVIPDGVTTIGDEAFRYCTSLESVTIPDSVTSLGQDVFDGCPFLDEASKDAIARIQGS